MKHVPNILTVSRIVLILLFVILANFDDENITCIHTTKEKALLCHQIALFIALIAGITDILDGYLARKFHVVSDFGRLIDPIADKIFIVATFVTAMDYHLIPGWIVIVILTREFMVTALRTLATSKGIIIAADKWGKLKTALQMFSLALIGCSWIQLGGFSLESISVLWTIILSAVVFVTLASGLGYFFRYRTLFQNSF